MRRSMFFSAFGAFGAAFVVLGAREANAGPMLIDYVQRQATTPGVAEPGHFNITGTAKAGLFSGSGASLTNLSANQLLSGIVPDARLSANVAQLNKNNLFNASQRFVANVELLGQNGGLIFPTPSVNSAVPLISMFGTGNTSFERTILGVSSADTSRGLRYFGYNNSFVFRGSDQVLGVDLDGFVWAGNYGNPGSAVFYSAGRSGVNAAGRFNANGSTYALTTAGDVDITGNLTTYGGRFYSNVNVDGNLGVRLGSAAAAVELAIDDPDTGINGSAGALDFILNGVASVYVRSGKLGVGRAPSYPLDVVGRAHFRNATNGERIRIFTDASDVGNVWTLDPNGAAKAVMASRQTGGSYGAYVAACDGGGIPAAYLDARAADGHGRVIADEKNFKAINPRDPSTDIYYASIEGPEAAMYVRGKGRLVNGRGAIDLPDHFTDLANLASLTIQLTPASFRSTGLAYEIDAQGNIVVGELANGKGNYEFSWVATAVRKGFEDYEVIRSWKEAPSTHQTEAEAWAARMKKIQAKRGTRQP